MHELKPEVRAVFAIEPDRFIKVDRDSYSTVEHIRREWLTDLLKPVPPRWAQYRQWQIRMAKVLAPLFDQNPDCETWADLKKKLTADYDAQQVAKERAAAIPTSPMLATVRKLI